jgi:hypothetical protein
MFRACGFRCRFCLHRDLDGGTNRVARGCPGTTLRAQRMEAAMGFGRGALLWLLGVPLPIILILALFMHH